MNALPAGLIALTLLLAWSGLLLGLGRASRADRPPEPEPGGSGDLPWLAGSLVMVLGGLVAMLAMAEARVFGLPAPFVTCLPILIAYSALLFDVGRQP